MLHPVCRVYYIILLILYITIVYITCIYLNNYTTLLAIYCYYFYSFGYFKVKTGFYITRACTTAVYKIAALAGSVGLAICASPLLRSFPKP